MINNKPKLRCILDNGVILPKKFRWDDAISLFCRKEEFGFLADRFGYLNQFSKINAAAISKDKFPISTFTKSLSEIMLERATYIYTYCKNHNCDCVVLWSGGCDSTAIVASFLSICTDLSFLTILHTASSIDENPEFYTIIKNNNIKMQQCNALAVYHIALDYAVNGSIVVTGFPADQLFGSILGQKYPKDTTKEHFSIWLKDEQYHHNNLVFKESDTAIQQYEEAFNYYNLPIKTIAEFLWFNNFALKWDYVNNWIPCVTHQQSENILSFYNTYEFECWSLSNFDILHKHDQKDIKNYKIQLKDFIYSITKLRSTYQLKKIPSIQNSFNKDGIEDLRLSRISALDDTNTLITVDLPPAPVGPTDTRMSLCAASIIRRYLK